MILFLDKKINNNTIGRRAKEREDFNMTEKIRDEWKPDYRRRCRIW